MKCWECSLRKCMKVSPSAGSTPNETFDDKCAASQESVKLGESCPLRGLILDRAISQTEAQIRCCQSTRRALKARAARLRRKAVPA